MRYPMFTPRALVTALASLGLAHAAFADDDFDFGLKVEQQLKTKSEKLFGVEKPLTDSAPATAGAYRTPSQNAYDQVALARGLKVEYLTRNAANATDMMTFYPAANPTHLITCVEGSRQQLSDGRYNPSVQRIRLSDGAVETVLRGMTACDGITTTAWGTVLATEETSSGGAYEILNPLAVTNQTVLDRSLGTVTDPNHIAKRTALPTMAWEGLAVLPNGIVIAGDELRPGTPANADGGAIFKFIPTVPHTGGMISNLNQSPFVAGFVYAMQVSCVNSTQQFGQGCEIGNAAWIPVNAASARSDANAAGATGYYRPEDLHQDPLYRDPANPDAVRFCWTNTGNEDAMNYAEVVCGVDRAPLTATATQRTVVVNRFVEGDSYFSSFDNLEFPPKTGYRRCPEDHRLQAEKGRLELVKPKR